VDPKVLELNVLIYHSQPGESWTTRRSPPIRWWSQCGGDDTVMVLLWSWLSQVPEKPQSEGRQRTGILSIKSSVQQCFVRSSPL